ncbi:ketoacyl-ACP synthase III [Agriterribacter sp.]|uniref:3-oxoacyl-ACP synthase III family protein n=1 Tax=Agriterribacter sp. TaxID=2821509 RepID=UPI002C57B2A7|nr:ketoacyl-ACP synthase III [Agriterribacter sp.]HRO48268.1 ketoacyl-ACP synthase III [Agriterribacter sp.]HRQ18091.1 ketoacyl-ACP synthase III [Agriterribacter sp.]
MSDYSSAYIAAISYCLPSTELTNEQLSKAFPEWSVAKIMNKVGIAARRVVAKDEFTSDLAVAAAQNLFNEDNLNPADIDYLILCTQSPDYFLPATACVVHERLQLSSTAGAIDINQGCSGFVYGIGLAKGLIAAGDVSNVLLITAETYSRFLHPEDKGNRSIFGDAAAAVLISANPAGGKIDKVVLGTDGKGAKNLIVKNGAMRFPKTADKSMQEDKEGNIFNDNYLYMNGAEIFNFTLESVPVLVKNILERNNLQQEDIDLFIFHQANRFMLEYLRKKIKISPERFYIYMEHCGNTVSSTIPIAMKQALLEGKIKRGSKVLVAGFGVGYSWGGAVLRF